LTAAAERLFEAGQWDDSLALLQPAVRRRGRGDAVVRVHGLIALIAGHRDNAEMADEHLAAVGDQANGPGRLPAGSCFLLLARAVAAERAGRPAEAVAVLAQCLDRRVAENMTHRNLLLPVLARLALAAGDAAAATAAAQAARQEAERQPRPVKMAAAGHCRGLVDGDPVPLLTAAAHYDSAGRPPDRAQVLEDAAVLLARHGEMAAARRAFSSAASLYGELRAAWDLRRADARLRRDGIRLDRTVRQLRPARGWGALTPAETKVAYLVADGRSNPEIAAALFLSRNTVQTHVSHILAKLGARSRGEIIRQALQHPAAS
jgi:DNA-binding CsgD family transcriptional regulator